MGDFVHEGREEASMVPGKDDSGKDGEDPVTSSSPNPKTGNKVATE